MCVLYICYHSLVYTNRKLYKGLLLTESKNMVKRKTAYTQLKEKHDNYKLYAEIAERVEKNEVIPNIHVFGANVLKKKGLKDEANELINSKTRPDNHALLGLMQEGRDIFEDELDDFGKNDLVRIINSNDLRINRVRDALLLIPPENDVPNYKALSDAHKEASEFYQDLYLYQQDGRISDDQKAAIVNNMRVRVIKSYHNIFKNDERFFNRLGALIQGYEDITIAQFKRLEKDKRKIFSDKLSTSNTGGYINAMNLSKKQRSVFYQMLLNSKSN